MHVADVTMFHAPQSGGVRRYLQEKHAWFAQHPAYRHSLVLPRGAAPRSADIAEVPSVPLPFSHGYRLPLGIRAAARALCGLKPDLIEAGDPYHLAWAALDAGRTLGVPVAAFYHSDLPGLAGKHLGARAERWAGAYVRRLYSRFDLVLAPSLAMADRLRRLGVPRVRHQPLGVDTGIFCPQRRNPAWRLRLGARRGERLLVFVGRFAPEKNLPELYDALGRLGPGYLLVLVGCGPRPARREGVRILPYITDPAELASLVASCDIFVHAGDRETFGLAALEAMACGLPVVAPCAGGLAELVDDDVGVAVPVKSAARLGEALADGIRELTARNAAPLRAAARRRAQLYDWARIMAQLVEHYRALLDRAPLRPPLWPPASTSPMASSKR